MAERTDPYRDTSVPVARSQEAIRKLLMESGALGVRFDGGRFQPLGESIDGSQSPCEVEFIWRVEGGQQIVRLRVYPKAAERAPMTRRSRAQGWKVSPEQRLRQAWRGLYWYLEGALKAAVFGLVKFEDVFLSFIVTGADPAAPTIGELMIEHLQRGVHARALLYEAPEGAQLANETVVEGEVVVE